MNTANFDQELTEFKNYNSARALRGEGYLPVSVTITVPTVYDIAPAYSAELISSALPNGRCWINASSMGQLLEDVAVALKAIREGIWASEVGRKRGNA